MLHEDLFYTAREAAEIMRDALTTEAGDIPSIHANKVKGLIEAGRLTNASDNAWMKVSGVELAAFIEDTRYVTADELLENHPLIYRVSVTPRHESAVYNEDGILRRFAGVDFSDDPDSGDELGGWEGVWPIAESKIDELIEKEGLLLASFRGYVAPGHLREISEAEAVGSRWYFHTRPARRDVIEFVGSGLWIDIPDGPISDFIA